MPKLDEQGNWIAPPYCQCEDGYGYDKNNTQCVGMSELDYFEFFEISIDHVNSCV